MYNIITLRKYTIDYIIHIQYNNKILYHTILLHCSLPEVDFKSNKSKVYNLKYCKELKNYSLANLL